MENSLVCISGVRGYEKDGVAYLHIEDVARGLGFTEKKDDVDYVKWSRVESHLNSLGFDTCVENGKLHDYYIPENIFYRRDTDGEIPQDCERLVTISNHTGFGYGVCLLTPSRISGTVCHAHSKPCFE